MSDRISTLGVEGDDVVYVVLGAAGVAGFAVGLIVGSRALRMLGLASAVAGGCLLVRRKWTERNEKIDEAATAIRSELGDLDPVARAQVLADLAQSEL
jgi:hypothetical protein